MGWWYREDMGAARHTVAAIIRHFNILLMHGAFEVCGLGIIAVSA
jgi:hypothetical protein